MDSTPNPNRPKLGGDSPGRFTWGTFALFEILCTGALVVAIIVAGL